MGMNPFIFGPEDEGADKASGFAEMNSGLSLGFIDLPGSSSGPERAPFILGLFMDKSAMPVLSTVANTVKERYQAGELKVALACGLAKSLVMDGDEAVPSTDLLDERARQAAFLSYTIAGPDNEPLISVGGVVPFTVLEGWLEIITDRRIGRIVCALRAHQSFLDDYPNPAFDLVFGADGEKLFDMPDALARNVELAKSGDSRALYNEALIPRHRYMWAKSQFSEGV